MDGHAVIVGRLPVAPLPIDPVLATPAEPQVRRRGSRATRMLGRGMLNLVFLAMIGSAGIMLGPALLGFQRYVILTGSMTGTYDRGSIVYDRPVPTSQLKVGDPITYSPPPGYTSQALVSHRIWSIHRGPDGARVFKTKGDANQNPDVWTFTLNSPTQNKVIFHIPEVGYLFLLLSLRNFRIVLVGLPCVIIGFVLLRRLWREGGEAARAQKLAEHGWRALPETHDGAVLGPLQTPRPELRPAQLNLRLRPTRRGPERAGPSVTPHRHLDVNLPLRIRRLRLSDGATLSAVDAGDSSGAGSSPAAVHLHVVLLS